MPGAGTAPDLARYRIIRPLGRGGLGEVFLAHDHTLDRDVAIKLLTTDHLADDGTRRRLLREARASASLDHPGICAVYEVGEAHDGRAFIAMQYIAGETLETMLERGPLPVHDVLLLCARMAEALGVAHKKGVVHRDLKPGNVMIAPDGRPILVDFGIATTATTGGASSGATAATTMTATRGVAGTPPYMSPEQVQQQPLDGRSDLFALGLILFECLTGRRAFDERSSLETVAAVIYVEPPLPSTLRSGLTAAHDDLCRRLMAKRPEDRFQSAEEVIGAIRLLLSTASTKVARARQQPRARRPLKALAGVLLVLSIGGMAAAWKWMARGSLPPVPAAAQQWSDRGTEAIRQEAYETGRKELEEAVRLFPQHALAYARLAEANMELDNPRAAQETLLRVSALVPDESRLPPTERLRVQAVRALVLRDVDEAVAAYRQLVALEPDDAGAWVDLGQAQEAAGLQTYAGASFRQAINRDQQYAAAYLRLGVVTARDGRRDDSLAAFRRAEALYHARSDVEGEAQVLIARGRALDLFGELRPARADLERALRLASDAKILYQQLGARLALSAITASEGHYADGQAQASAAVRDALANGLETIAAGGLIDLSATLLQEGRADQAEAETTRAIEIAERRGALVTAARAKTQLASILDEAGQSSRALDLLADVLPVFKSGHYRARELTALSIAARAHEHLDHLEQARQLSTDVLHLANAAQDEAQIALAATNLASVTAALGDYPAALALRQRAEPIHRRLGDEASLPYDLTNRAELLIRLGRPSEAETALAEVDAGIAKGVDSYRSRRGRVVFLRAMASAIDLRCKPATDLLRALERAGGAPGAPAVWAPAIAAFCSARIAHRLPPAASLEHVGPAYAREARFWRGAAALEAHDAPRALAESRAGLALLASLPNDELRWRLAAVGALAARQTGDAAAAADLIHSAREAFARLRSAWANDIVPYERRADIARFGSRAGIF
jgi:tetratricopeptide (TPR) repeat protein/predicted Ser/Thr protein kinase